MNKLKEKLTEACHSALFLQTDIREAHKLACEASPLAEILLRELIADATRIVQRLDEINRAMGSGE